MERKRSEVSATSILLMLFIVPIVLFSSAGTPPAHAAVVSNAACDFGLCWFQDGTAYYTNLGSLHPIAITYTNTINSTVTGVVFAVMHNDRGQTVEYSTATLTLGTDANGTAYPIVFGLPPGVYSVTFVVVRPSGVAISTTTTITITVSG